MQSSSSMTFWSFLTDCTATFRRLDNIFIFYWGSPLATAIEHSTWQGGPASLPPHRCVASNALHNPPPPFITHHPSPPFVANPPSITTIHCKPTVPPPSPLPRRGLFCQPPPFVTRPLPSLIHWALKHHCFPSPTLLFTTYRSHFNDEKGPPFLLMLKVSHLHGHPQ